MSARRLSGLCKFNYKGRYCPELSLRGVQHKGSPYCRFHRGQTILPRGIEIMDERIAIRAGCTLAGKPVPKGLLDLRKFMDANCLRKQQITAGEVHIDVSGVELIPLNDPVLKRSLVIYQQHFNLLTGLGIARKYAHEQAVARVGHGDGFAEM